MKWIVVMYCVAGCPEGQPTMVEFETMPLSTKAGCIAAGAFATAAVLAERPEMIIATGCKPVAAEGSPVS